MTPPGLGFCTSTQVSKPPVVQPSGRYQVPAGVSSVTSKPPKRVSHWPSGFFTTTFHLPSAVVAGKMKSQVIRLPEATVRLLA